jgi:hypothetical protein
MPKKSRRAKAKHRATVARALQDRRSQEPGSTPAEVQAPAPVASSAQVRRTQGAGAQLAKPQDLASRYLYVMPEVKRIGIIAGSMIVVLIILSFVLG